MSEDIPIETETDTRYGFDLAGILIHDTGILQTWTPKKPHGWQTEYIERTCENNWIQEHSRLAIFYRMFLGHLI